MDEPKGNIVQRVLCRTNLWHVWRPQHAIEGSEHWERCERCGKERDSRPAIPGG
jgi:hypothetical protein